MPTALRHVSLACVLLLSVFALTACPRKPEPTADQRGGTSGESRNANAGDATADGGLAPPLEHAVPPTNATPVPLPEDIIDDYPDADLSDDRSVLRAAFPEAGKAYYFQGFSVPGDDHEALLNYFTDALRRDGLEPNAELNAETLSGPGFFDGHWASADGLYTVRVYNFDHAAAEAGGEQPLVMFVSDSSLEPVDAPAEVGQADSFEREDAEPVPHDHDGDGVSDHGDEAHGGG